MNDRGRKESRCLSRIFPEELAPFGVDGKHHAIIAPDDSMNGAVVSWTGDARDLPKSHAWTLPCSKHEQRLQIWWPVA